MSGSWSEENLSAGWQRIKPKGVVYLLFLSLGYCLVASEIIGFLSRYFLAWIAALYYHLVLASLVLYHRVRRKKTNIFAEYNAPRRGWHFRGLKPYLPSILLLFFVVLMSRVNYKTPVGELELNTRLLMSLSAIPVLEEICYRVGVSSLLIRFGGEFWGRYFSILVFTLMHSNPSAIGLMAGEVGFLPGPFLLALCCELIYWWSKRIAPAIFLHACCNATGIIFYSTGGYWLEVLAPFYIA